MKTLSKTILALSGLLLVAGCTASAQDPTPPAVQAYGPGWRHEQMVQARNRGELPGPAMMQRRGFGPGQGYGPMMAVGPDGKVDPTQLPPWCPYRTTPPTDTDK